jgi:hypothetical protein
MQAPRISAFAWIPRSRAPRHRPRAAGNSFKSFCSGKGSSLARLSMSASQRQAVRHDLAKCCAPSWEERLGDLARTILNCRDIFLLAQFWTFSPEWPSSPAWRDRALSGAESGELFALHKNAAQLIQEITEPAVKSNDPLLVVRHAGRACARTGVRIALDRTDGSEKLTPSAQPSDVLCV